MAGHNVTGQNLFPALFPSKIVRKLRCHIGFIGYLWEQFEDKHEANTNNDDDRDDAQETPNEQRPGDHKYIK